MAKTSEDYRTSKMNNTQKNQLDSAIKGQIEKKIKQVVSEKLSAYDKI